MSVCEGYAEAMNSLLISAGIKSYIIDGYGDGGLHEWNLVNIHGSLYHLDATFDDPISAKGNVITHNYFNVNDEQISKNHTWDKANYPSTNAVEANYFVVNKLIVNDGSMYYQVVKNAIIKKISVFNIRTKSYDTKTYNPNVIAKVLKEITIKNNVSKSLSYSFNYDLNTCVIEILLNYK